MRIFAISIIALWMLVGGVAHLVTPEFFFQIVPDMFPKLMVVYVSGVIEIAIGAAILVPKLRAVAGLCFAILCVGFLPLHVWDFFRPDPVFEVPVAASIRILVQFGLIGLGLFLWRTDSRPNTTEPARVKPSAE